MNLKPQVNQITMKPIGIVKNDFKDEIPDDYRYIPSNIEIDPAYSYALEGLESNSHIVVLFWMDRVEKEQRGVLRVHPKGREDLPLVGVFATRSPSRPNPIGMRTVRLVSREGNIVKVMGLDALNGSPVVDIKPYSLKHDYVENARVPAWVKSLEKKKG